MTIQQAWRGIQREYQQDAVGLGQVERAFQGTPGGGRVAECLPGDRPAGLMGPIIAPT
jgi:hypothetical protein